jgi:hypothetical protein
MESSISQFFLFRVLVLLRFFPQQSVGGAMLFLVEWCKGLVIAHSQ